MASSGMKPKRRGRRGCRGSNNNARVLNDWAEMQGLPSYQIKFSELDHIPLSRPPPPFARIAMGPRHRVNGIDGASKYS